VYCADISPLTGRNGQDPASAGWGWQLKAISANKTRWCYGLFLALAVLLAGHVQADEKQRPILQMAGMDGVPDDHWPDLFFWHFDRITDTLGLHPLREMQSISHDREIRIWLSSFSSANLFRLIESDGAVSGAVYRSWPEKYGSGASFHERMVDSLADRCGDFRLKDGKASCRAILDPIPDWNSLLSHVELGGLWTLPDPSRLPPINRFQSDGWGIVVELHDGERYRTYRYHFPIAAESWPEGRAAKTIAEAFSALLD